MNWWEKLTHKHYWVEEEVGEPQSDMKLAIALLYNNYCKCSECGESKWISRDDYVQHLKETKRLG